MKKRLLIIDSDVHLNKLNEKVLRSSGIVDDLHIVNNGQDALDYLQTLLDNNSSLPDVIVFELQMPIVNGFEFIDQFSKFEISEKETVELVVFTASSKPSDRQKAISKGIRHYLSKPYLLRGLRDILLQLHNKQPITRVMQ